MSAPTFRNLFITLTGFNYRVVVASSGRIMGVLRKTKRGETALDTNGKRAQRIITLVLAAVAATPPLAPKSPAPRS